MLNLPEMSVQELRAYQAHLRDRKIDLSEELKSVQETLDRVDYFIKNQGGVIEN